MLDIETKPKNKEYNAPRLCGGTFFTLLLRATKQGLNKRKSFGDRSAFTEGDVLEGLIKIVDTEYKRPTDKANFKSAVSPYKSCNASKSGRLPITDPAIVSTFDSDIKINYKIVASQMAEFAETYVEVKSRGEWLIKALLALIEADTSIKNVDEFYINQDGTKLLKANISCLNQVCLPTFLLGIWHFIITKRQDNSIGKKTYDDWHRQGSSKNAKKTYVSKIGESTARKIDLIPFSIDTAETVEAEIISDIPEKFSSNQSSETYDTAATSQPIQNTELKYQQNSLVVNMSGSHNSIGNIIMSQTIIKGKEEA